MEMIDCDTLIIGGGSAGCALAARLSANSGRRVVLLEAGPDGSQPMHRVMRGKLQLTGDPRFDWNYLTEPEPFMMNRRLVWPRGKVLGGSSAINGLLANRGNRSDYDDWAALGCSGWGWGEVLPYFLRLEDFGPNYKIGSELHNTGGPLPVSSARARHFLCDKFVSAAKETLDVDENSDFDGEAQEGAGYYAVNVSRGLVPRRVSAASAYLKSARHRPNLRIITGSHVHRITFAGLRASGAVFDRAGVQTAVTARRQVVLSAGTIASPQLLQLSGIGDPDHLRSLGIEVVLPLAAVGENLQDHLQIPSRFRFAARSVGEKLHNASRRFLLAFQGVVMQTGLFYGATNFGIFARTDRSLNRPDVQFHVHPAAGSVRSADRFSILSISGWQLRPQSRGRICLHSADPHAAPAIFANYLSTDMDRRMAVTVLRIARRLTESSALRPYIAERLYPAPNADSDAELLEAAKLRGETTYHPVGTCRMGSDPGSVVDTRLRVRGIEGLYVADASIMPTVIAGNPNVPSVMIGEKASDLIIEDERRARPAEITAEAKVTV